VRVLFVEHGSTVGGAERSLLELMRELSSLHDLGLACPDGDLARAAASVGVSTLLPLPHSQLTFRLDPRQTPLMAARMAAAARSLRTHVGRWQPDVIHANSIRAGLLAAPAARRAPLVTHCRDVLPAGTATALVRTSILKSARRTIAISRYVAEAFAGPKWHDRGVRVVDNPIDTDRFDPAQVAADGLLSELGLGGRPVLSIIGQITHWKRQDHAIRVLAELRSRGMDACLLIVGRPLFTAAATRFDNLAFERELHELVDELGVRGSVHFLGHREDPERILAATDLLLAPSSEEPFGRTIVEALAMGVPVIATVVGGPPEIIRAGLDGATLPPDEPVGWADAVQEVLAHDLPEAKGNRADYARDRFDSARHAERIAAIYREAVS
jgi:glycosyltransferase involved in cell wall biosynthesis